MMPFIHIGPFTIASFGLLVGIAMFVSYFVLAKDAARRAIQAPADLLIAVPCIAGLIGAKLYHVFEDPRYLFAHPSELISQYGFAWFGGLLAGVAAFVWLARHYRIPLLEIFDAASPAAALGYGIGRIGCLISGDGDYGKPTHLPWGMAFPHGTVPTTLTCVEWGWPASCRVQPTPIYELIVAIFIFWWLWKLGGRQVWAAANPPKVVVTHKVMSPQEAEEQSRALRNPIHRLRRRLFFAKLRFWRRPPMGMVFAQYLILTGIARFLVEFIRINPRSFFGMTNAQAAGLASILLGIVLIFYLRRNRRQTPATTP
ncbi:MAG TPA: prolipoprotein diacylglyceryl transferase [Candidatus Acidoferrales bacterium]|nr:prolipoprotein diacylglyceryl transferase [Candidatus Acidoferrales bacterium]